MKHNLCISPTSRNPLWQFFASIGFILLVATSVPAYADNSVKLQVTLKGEHKDPAKSVEELNQRWLEIATSAFHLEKPAEIRLEWALFGDSLDFDNVVKHGEGTELITLVPGKKVTIQTKSITFAFTPRHTARRGNGRQTKLKKVEATGTRYHGWGVRAFVDGRLAGEAYSLPEIQKRMTSRN